MAQVILPSDRGSRPWGVNGPTDRQAEWWMTWQWWGWFRFAFGLVWSEFYASYACSSVRAKTRRTLCPTLVHTPIYLSWCLSLVINRICAFALDAARWSQWATMSNLLPPSPSACKSGWNAMQILFYSHETVTMTTTIYKCALYACFA